MNIGSLISAGKQVDEVELNIDYRIIEHFSENLYPSPNKAIEELVANGFDAFAREVYVYTPGEQVRERLVVWDDGTSMDVKGLQDLWVIASSPKAEERVQRGPRGDERHLIGKFGIGKLASYTVGNEIAHLCRREGQFLLVGVDYRDIHGDEGHARSTMDVPLTRPIVEVSEADARRFVEELFESDTDPAALQLFERRSWTLAVIAELKVRRLPPGRLRWVIGNGMPLRPDFRVWVNDEEVQPRFEEGDLAEWGFDEPSVRSGIEKLWKEASEEGRVTGAVEFRRTTGIDPYDEEAEVAVLKLPKLGDVWGRIRLFQMPLTTGRSTEAGRSHGFFIMVLGRLVNPRDPRFLLHDPQFGAFNRTQIVIHADGLDAELLADRTGVHEDTALTDELHVLQVALYRAARAELDNRDTEDAQTTVLRNLLPTRSRDHYRRPLMALLAGRGITLSDDFDVGNPQIEARALGEGDPLATFSEDGAAFVVNVSHPLYPVLRERLGKGKKAGERFEQWYKLFGVADLLLEGSLFERGLDRKQVEEVVAWRDGLYRELASSYEENHEELLRELRNASYAGDVEFENAIAAVLRAMGFHATQKGDPGVEDVFLLASVGPEGTFRMTFEAKGKSKGAVQVDEAEVGAAARHRVDAGADHAVIVARTFSGFGRNSRNEKAAILKECRSQEGQAVSIMTVEALERLFKAVVRFAYPLDLLKSVFTGIESPERKLERIQELEDPTESFPFREILEDIWERQHMQAEGDWVSYRTICQNRPEWKGPSSFDFFWKKLLGLDALALGRIEVDETRELVILRQSPELIVEAIENQLSPASEDHEARNT